jgi:hypothetical protein
MYRIGDTRNTENSLRRVEVRMRIVERNMSHLSRSRQHTLTCIKACARSILNFLDFRTLFPDDGAHARVRDHELDSYGAAPWNRWDIKRFIIYTPDDESESLFKEME